MLNGFVQIELTTRGMGVLSLPYKKIWFGEVALGIIQSGMVQEVFR